MRRIFSRNGPKTTPSTPLLLAQMMIGMVSNVNRTQCLSVGQTELFWLQGTVIPAKYPPSIWSHASIFFSLRSNRDEILYPVVALYLLGYEHDVVSLNPSLSINWFSNI